MPKPLEEHPSLLEELYLDKRIDAPVMSFWKDSSREGLHVHFGKLDLSQLTYQGLTWIDLDADSHGWGVTLNSILYGEAKIESKITRVEFELGIPSISLPDPAYSDLCYEMKLSNSQWAASDGDCLTSIKAKCP